METTETPSLPAPDSPQTVPAPSTCHPRPEWGGSPPGPGIGISGLLFFCTIGVVADCFNFNGAQSEIFVAAGPLKASEVGLGTLGASSALGYMIPCLATGLLSERLGRRPMVIASMAGLLAVYLRLPFAAGLPELCLLSCLRAASTAMLWPPLMAWMTEITAPAALPQVLSRYNMSWSAGILLGFGLSGWIFERFGPAMPFHISAVLAFLLLLFVLLFYPRPVTAGPGNRLPRHGSGSENVQSGDLAAAFGLSASQCRLWIFRGLGLMLLGCATQGIILYLTPKIVGPEVRENAQSMLQVLRMGGQLTSFFLFSATTVWHFRRWPFAVSLGCFASGLLIASAAGPHAATPAGYAALGAGYALVGFGFGIAFSVCSYYTLGLFRTKGLGSGIMETLIGAGGFFGPPVAGHIAARTSPRVALLAILAPLGAGLLLALPWEKWKRGGRRVSSSSSE